MARGPEPKDPGARRRRNMPARGEWTDLPSASGRRAPRLPTRRGAWPDEAKRAWKLWWADPAASQWTAADEIAVAMLLRLFVLATLEPKFAPEVRLRTDALGLSPKGKRDLRWRVITDPAHTAGPRPGNDELSQRRERRQRVKATDAVAGT